MISGCSLKKSRWASSLPPLALMFLTFRLTGQRPWLHPHGYTLSLKAPVLVEAVFKNLGTWGLPAIMVVVGIFEFAFGLYEREWTRN